MCYRIYLFKWFTIMEYYYYYYYLVYIYGTFSLHQSIIDFFFLVYICVTFFVTRLYIYIETYCHIVMVINSKLLIWSWHFWKIYQIKSNQTTLYTLNRTCDRKIKVRYSESFGQTAWQSVMLKMTQNHAKVHCEHSQSSLSSMNK